MKHLTKDNFVEELKNKLVLVDFYAGWCGPCRMFEPILEQLAEENVVEIVKVNVDEESKLARQYHIMSIPTIMLFKNGEMLKQAVGFHPLEELRKFIKE